MTQIPAVNQSYPVQSGTLLNNYVTPGSVVATNNGQTGTVVASNTNPNTYQVYNYPTSSVYGTAQPQSAGGVNIYITNPSAIGGPCSNSFATGTYPVTGANGVMPASPMQSSNGTNANASAIANTPLNSESTKESDKKKKVVELTDDYIKTLESYLRSADADVRKSGIIDLINRFEEDSSRYEDPALTALLNIALQDPDANNRMLAMSPVAGENAHGDQNTINLLKALQTSDKVYGQEAKMANEALLKCAQTKKEIPA